MHITDQCSLLLEREIGDQHLQALLIHETVEIPQTRDQEKQNNRTKRNNAGLDPGEVRKKCVFEQKDIARHRDKNDHK